MYVNNDYPNSNVVNSIVIHENIENLRHMFVYYDKGAHDISLDVSQTVPKGLSVFDVYTERDCKHKYGSIEGDEHIVN